MPGCSRASSWLRPEERRALSVLGQLLEIGIATADIAASASFYERLGFTQLPCNDPWPYAYCALSDGELVLGLHARSAPSTSLCFVQSGLAQQAHALRSIGLPVVAAHLREDQFHHLLLQDPGGNPILLLEARTFSPPAGYRLSRCGAFSCYALPAPDLEASAEFWERAGMIAFPWQESPFPHRPVSGDRLNLALCEPGFLGTPALVFIASDMDRRVAALSDDGLRIDVTPAGARLHAPEGTPLLLLGD